MPIYLLGLAIDYLFGQRIIVVLIKKFWSRDINNISGTQEIFDHRAKMCTLASQGKSSENLENKK